jgi:hypothetical protein
VCVCARARARVCVCVCYSVDMDASEAERKPKTKAKKQNQVIAMRHSRTPPGLKQTELHFCTASAHTGSASNQTNTITRQYRHYHATTLPPYNTTRSLCLACHEYQNRVDVCYIVDKTE